MENEQNTFIIIPDCIQKNTQIDWPHRAIFGIVYAFSVNGGECWLSVTQIGERIHRKRRQTSAMIQKLLDLKLIEIAQWNGRKRSLKINPNFEIVNVQLTAHVQLAAQHTGNKSHNSRAEIRTTAARKSALKEYNKEEKKEKNKKQGEKNSGQKPNSIEDCKNYFFELGSNDFENFWDYWSSIGWKRRSGKIVCWKSTARNWVRKNKNDTHEKIDKNKPFDSNNAIEWATK